MPELTSRPRWLLLAYQLPTRPSHLRVRIWRRLQQIGAAVLRNSIYVLPNTDETREDLEWVRSEIVAHRGQASLLEASALDGYTDSDLIAQARADRDEEYGQLLKEAAAVQQTLARRSRNTSRPTRQRALRTLRERLAAIIARDHFQAPGRADAAAAVLRIERAFDGQPPTAAGRERLRPEDYRGRTWLTRPHPGIDRMASAWLIRRFIDADARFAFGSSRGRASHHVAFDMPDVELGHHGMHCTFETLLERFAIDDRAASYIGEIVHDLDLKETRYGRHESLAIGRIVDGLRQVVAEDRDLLERGILVIEALYRSLAASMPVRPRSHRPIPRRKGAS